MAMRFRPARTMRRSSQVTGGPAQEELGGLVALAYELLDAHADTARLVIDEASDAEWDNHLAYLRDLQRVGRELIAQAESTRH
jgi:hypothetical protein